MAFSNQPDYAIPANIAAQSPASHIALLLPLDAPALKHAALALQAASTDDARFTASINLQSQFPETYAAIRGILTVSNVAKETAITALEEFISLAYSPEMNELMWSRLGVNAADLVGWATKNPERAVELSIENVGANLAVSAAISVSAALVADSLFAVQPMASVPQSWQNPLKALVRATIVEVTGLARASANPAAVVSPLVNRLIDVVEIYKATRALTRVVDEALVATALGLETSAQLAVDYPDPRSQHVAEATVADLLGRVREFVGKDDEAAVQEIGDLTYTALISQRRGDLQIARELVEQIQREGKLSSNIHPFSAITKPIDWLTAVARGGRDTPEQAANIMITVTALRDLLSESFAEWAHRDAPDFIVLPGESAAGFSLGSNGTTYYKDKQVFGAWQPGNGSDFRLQVFRAPGGKSAVVLYSHPDFGAMRIGIVDMVGDRVLNNKIEPFSRWGPSELAFSPDGGYVALQFPTGEFTSELGFFETETGRFALHQSKSPNPDVFFTPELRSLVWQESGVLRLRQIRWGFGVYDLPEELGAEAAQISLPELFAQSADMSKQAAFLSFPLRCGDKDCSFRYSQGAYTPGSITSILDHDMHTPYKPLDGKILTFTGEKGEGPFMPNAVAPCYPNVDKGKSFNVLRLYVGTDDGCLSHEGINYDNHPGYDYKAALNTPVYTAAPGHVLAEKCVPKGISDCDSWGYIGIDHGNGYVTQYGHLNDIFFKPGDPIPIGEQIGLSGDKGVERSPHLHFEVLKKLKKESKDEPQRYVIVDPYGWEGGAREDLLAQRNNTENVRLWEFDPRECLLNWAELAYGYLLSPSGSNSKIFYPFSYRHYQITNSYLGVSSIDNHVYYVSPHNMLHPVGDLSHWLSVASCYNTGSVNLPSLTNKLNDTGITTCSDNSANGLPCPVSGFPGQDAEHGRDALAAAGMLQKMGGGSAGFDFTKLDANGNPLPASSTVWSCVKDNHTGLIWEIKTTSGLRSLNHTYSWYNPDHSTDGGDPGVQNGGNCSGSSCDTHGYVHAVNAQGLCGASDWRMPASEELRGIVDYGRINPAIDTGYFSNTPSSHFWSSSPGFFSRYYTAWSVHFSDGSDSLILTRGLLHVRLVRGG